MQVASENKIEQEEKKNRINSGGHDQYRTKMEMQHLLCFSNYFFGNYFFGNYFF